MAGRNAVLRGDVIELTAVFLDAANDPVDPTNIKISIYPPGHNPEGGAPVSEAWVYDVTLTSGGLGPEADPLKTLEKTDTGHYKYAFTVPAAADLGSAYDRWEGTVDLEDLDDTFNFVIVGGGSIGTTKLYDNNIVFIQLSKGIAALDGSLLAEDFTYYFTTTYTPLYSSIRRITLDLGSALNNIPSDAINFAIFEASLQADEMSFSTSISDMSFYKRARYQYVTCLAESILIKALLGDQGLSNRLSKTLGDLSISRGGAAENLRNMLAELEDCAFRWETAVQTGGEVAPGTSLKPLVAVKGSQAEDAITVGRQWYPTSGIGMYNSVPAANTQIGPPVFHGRRTLKSFRKHNR